MLNFGAFICFMGVNLAAFVRFFIRSEHKTFLNAVLPLLGFLICLYIWLSLGTTSMVVGLFWLATGLAYGAWRTNCFRKKIAFIALDDGMAGDSPKPTMQLRQ
jgi:putrescine importer